MKTSKKFTKNSKVHFIGVGGVNMSALAKHLICQGYEVSGSDISANNTAELKALGAKIYNGHNPKNVQNADFVVYTSAIKNDNPELNYAIKNGLNLIKRSELLGWIMDRYKRSIAISGSHGKTTTTNMLANVLICANLHPTVFLGGEDNSFGNYLKGTGDIIVAEACEYQRNFLDLHPKIAVVLNIDNDHMDTYKNLEQTASAFYDFCKNSISIINADDAVAKKISILSSLSFAVDSSANYMAKNIVYNGKGYSFTVYSSGRRLGRIRLKLAGKHNVYNAIAVVAVCELLKVPFSITKTSLENFSGVKRRNEYIGKTFGMNAWCDYAHHPKEISAMLLTYLKEDSKFITVFQPHTYSRTQLLMSDFIDSLKNCSPLIIHKTYPAREKFDVLGDGQTLYNELVKQECAKGNEIYYASDQKELERILKNLSANYKKVIFLGAGDIYDIANEIISKNS